MSSWEQSTGSLVHQPSVDHVDPVLLADWTLFLGVLLVGPALLSSSGLDLMKHAFSRRLTDGSFKGIHKRGGEQTFMRADVTTASWQGGDPLVHSLPGPPCG